MEKKAVPATKKDEKIEPNSLDQIREIIVGEKIEPNPVILFEDIPGYEKGFRTLYSLFGSPWRVAKTLGLPEQETDRMGLLRNWNQKVDKIPMIPPKMVDTAPFFENADTGNDVDLLKFGYAW